MYYDVLVEWSAGGWRKPKSRWVRGVWAASGSEAGAAAIRKVGQGEVAMLWPQWPQPKEV